MLNAKPRLVLALAATLLALGAASCGQQHPTLLAVHATGATRTAPDIAIVTLGVVARGDTARAAQEAQATRMEAVMQAVTAAGVTAEEVQTVGYALDPIYAYPRNAPPRVTGYQSRNIVSIRVRDLNAVSGLIDATIADGANELQGIQFDFDDREASRNAARAEAVATARARANAYAEAAEMRVRRIVSISEEGAAPLPIADGAGGGYGYARNALATEAQSVAPIRPGQLESASSVTVVFELN